MNLGMATLCAVLTWSFNLAPELHRFFGCSCISKHFAGRAFIG